MRTLQLRAYVGIVAVVLFIPSIILEVMRGMSLLSDLLLIPYFVITILSLGAWAYFTWGFFSIAEKAKNDLLKYATIGLIVTVLFFSLLGLLLFSSSEIVQGIIGLGMLFIVGIVSIFFGVGVMRMEKKLGVLAKAVGILNIVSGVSFTLIILFFIGMILFLPLAIMEILLMLKASKKLKI